MNLVQKYNDYRIYPSFYADFSLHPCDSYILLRQTPRIPQNPVAECSFWANNLEF